MSLFQNYFLTTIVADLLAEAVTLLCCRYIGPIPLLCKSIRGIMNKGLAELGVGPVLKVQTMLDP
jgi:hypothetical protein